MNINFLNWRIEKLIFVEDLRDDWTDKLALGYSNSVEKLNFLLESAHRVENTFGWKFHRKCHVVLFRDSVALDDVFNLLQTRDGDLLAGL